MTTCPCGLISGDKCTKVVGVLGSGRLCTTGGIYGKSPHLLLSFAVNLKLILNTKVLKEIETEPSCIQRPPRVSQISPRAAEPGYVGFVKSSTSFMSTPRFKNH